MSGHSKWHNIQAKKGAEDAKRGRAFTKITREIIIAAKAGGGNPETNSRLRAAVEKAKAAGMPNDNVKKAIMRGTGEMEGVTYEETTYEGYGPNGTAFIIMASTDNKNRTTSEIRRILSQHGGALGENGSVSWGFERKGSLDIDAGGRSYDDLFMIAVDSGAEDLKQDEESTTVITGPEDVYKVRQALEASGIPDHQPCVAGTGEPVGFIPRLVNPSPTRPPACRWSGTLIPGPRAGRRRISWSAIHHSSARAGCAPRWATATRKRCGRRGRTCRSRRIS